MNRLFAYLASAILVGGLTIAFIECGGAECGNGAKEGSEQCDDGAKNGTVGDGCSAMCQIISIPRATIELDVSFLVNESPGYNSGASPSDLGIGTLHVVVSGAQMFDEMWKSNMSSNQWVGVTPGDYSATVTLLDSSGNPLTKPVTTTMGHVDSPGMLKLMLNFHQSDFLKQDYSGPLYISPNWGGSDVSCTAATPAVTMESIQVQTMAGVAVTGMTQVGNPGTNEHNLDGTYGDCFYKNGSVNLFEKVPSLTWGHYAVILRGKAMDGSVAYCKKFDDVFVGPGIQNPTYELVVTPADADLGACP